MRKYIFTENERRRLEDWLSGGKENSRTLNYFVLVRRNLNPIKRDVELLSRVAQRLKSEGRLMGRVRLHTSTSELPPDESESNPKRSETST